jgi:lysophospholipase L1-like esterase
MKPRPRNWVFLGDSLTEGVGSRRVSYVSELTTLLRESEKHQPDCQRTTIHEFRLRRVDPGQFNRFLAVNTAGMWRGEDARPGASLWLWNFACEGTTMASDFAWLPLIDNLQPERVFVFRGALENIVRPAALADGQWPCWLPASWRGYARLDPRCYFSSTGWRRAKQRAADAIKQRVRLALLARYGAFTLINHAEFSACAEELFSALRRVTQRLHVLGMLPIANATFPGSAERFQQVNESLRRAACAVEADFFDWGCAMTASMNGRDCFYRDGFHPNQQGARLLAEMLLDRMAVPAQPAD